MVIGYDDPNLDFDPAGKFYSSQDYGLASLYEWHGNHYWFVGVVDAALVAGNLVEWSTTSGYVTNDRAGGSSAGRLPAGVAIIATPVGGFCFIQCSGTGTKTLTTDGSVAAAEYLMPHATTDGGVDTMAAGNEESHFGMAMAADATNDLVAGVWILKTCM